MHPTRRNGPPRRPASNVGLIALLVVMVAGFAAGGYSKPGKAGVPVLKWDLPSLAASFPAIPALPISFRMPRLRPLWTGLGGSPKSSFAIPRYGFYGCGGLLLTPEIRSRESGLPGSAVVLGTAFLKCRMIKAARLDPRVPVADYPAGHFGDWTHEGVLVTDRIEVADETELHQLFALLVEAIGDPGDPSDYFWTSEDPAFSVSGYRRESGFVPDLVFEFVGDAPFLVEISVAQERVLIRAGDRWETYALDRRSATALQEFLQARETKQPDRNL